jgi:predicted DNA-binding ribbon-helix-helix protein
MSSIKLSGQQLKKIIREELMKEADTLLGQFREDKEQLKMLASALRVPGGQVISYAADISATNPRTAEELELWHQDFSALLDRLEEIVDTSI